jgi:hypothetical protein
MPERDENTGHGREPDGFSGGSRSPAEGPRDDAPNSFPEHVSRITDRFGEFLPFALVPLVTSLLDVQAVQRALSDRGRGLSINIEFAFPSPLLDLWSFIDPPDPVAGTAGGSGSVASDGSTPPTTTGGADLTVETPIETVALPLEALGIGAVSTIALFVLFYAVLLAAIQAIYLGGLDRRLRGEPIVVSESLRRHTARQFLYVLAVFGGVLLLVPFLVAAPVFFLLAFPAALIFAYLFYLAPFLFVVEDAAFIEGLRRSFRFAVEGGPYLRFVV